MAFFAYIGPGAGLVLSGSFLVLFGTILVALLSLAAWPFRIAWRAIQTWRRARV
jgi:purine-cytosine permease-like protein